AAGMAKDPAARPTAAALTQAAPGLGALLTGRPAGPLQAEPVAPLPPRTPLPAGVPGRGPVQHSAWIPAAADPGYGQPDLPLTAGWFGEPAPLPGTGAAPRPDPLPTEAASRPLREAPVPLPARRSRWRPGAAPPPRPAPRVAP